MKVSRRAFLASTAITAGGAFAISFRMHDPWPLAKLFAATTDPFDLWIQIQSDGKTILTVEKCEMGQGVFTGLPMILAEEAELDWNTVTVQQSLESSGTGGSGSTSGSYLPLRRAGAVVREAMIGAAAHEWSVPKEGCVAQQSRVTHRASGRSLAYCDLVSTARRLPLPDIEHVPLKNPSDFKLIGHLTPALDIPGKVQGTACFGFDVRLPGMVFAIIARCPVFGGKAVSYDSSKALAVPGVLQVFEIEPRGFRIYSAGGVVVVAQSTWAALEGRRALTIKWDYGPHRNESSDALSEDLRRALTSEGKIIRDDGKVDRAFELGAERLEAIYEFPFLAHAAMEPMNATILLRKDKCEVWCPSQSPDWVRSAIAKELAMKESQVLVHTTFMGGGFGRRYIADYPTEAAQIARHVNGPVQLVWSREDDMTHDFYRPASYHRLRGAVDHSGNIVAWSHHIASTSIRAQWDPPETVKPESAEIGGAVHIPYSPPAIRVSYTPVESAVPRGWWRSVEHSFNGFAVECFIDELAVAAKQDPYLFRKANFLEAARQSTKSDGPTDDGHTDCNRLIAVLDLAAQRAGWGSPMRKNQGRGIACGTAYGYVAQVAEVTLRDGRIKVDRVVAAVDCGQVVNPNGVRQQIEGGIIFGLSAVLKGQITISQGQVEQTNFSGYELIRMPESPAIEVHLIENHFEPSGIGEAGVPLIGPAIANAVFAATGKRLRKLPLRPDKLAT
ncbi:MAG TPA: molybdopterin cofactor-binding domain-containing protein [Acidobacteriaceae bacterium]